MQFIEKPVGEILEAHAARNPEREFLVYADRDLRFTYKQFDERVNNLAKGFLALGIQKGQHLGVWANNVPDWLTILFATAKIGVTLVTVNTNYKLHELEYLIRQSDSTNAYGLTEASPVILQTRAEDPVEVKVGTVGRALPSIEVKLLDPRTGKECGMGEQGEICCRGYNVMRGYYKMPEATKEVIDADGWLHSGDLGVQDQDGNYRVTGRIKDMIIRGGENIYPKEIEDFLYKMPQIKDVQIAGVPSEKYGEEVGAFIILKDGMHLTTEEVQDYCRGQISRFKIPKYVFL